MTTYATANRDPDGTLRDIAPCEASLLAYEVDYRRSEWVMAQPETRGGFPVALRRHGDVWVECASAPPFLPLADAK